MKKQLKEWGIMIGVVGLLYITGLHTEVAGFVQRIVLATGLLQAEAIPPSEQLDADYNFILVDETGEEVAFDQFKDQTIFLNFWATWCPPCIAEMPDIHDLYLKTKDEGVEFILVSLDEDFEKAKSFVNRKGYTFPIYRLASRRPAVFASQSIPTTFVISPAGKIISKNTGMAKYDTEAFREILRTKL